MDNNELISYCNHLKAKYKQNKRVLMVQIPQLNFRSFNPENVEKRGYYVFPPTGLQYLHEAIKERDLDIKILDMNYLLLKKVKEDLSFNHEQWLSILIDFLDDFDPGIVAVSCMFDLAINSFFKVLEFLKKKDKHIIITGGVIASYEWKHILSHNLCHFVIKGEGENKINYLFDCLTNENKGWEPVAGIYYNYNNNICSSEGKKDVVNFKCNLIESYSCINIEDYYNYGSLNPFSRMAGIDISPFSPIQMSRGCRASCTFCSVRDFMGKGVRKRPNEEILKEMEFLINNRGIRHFEWLDDDLLFYKKDFIEILENIIARRWNITWSANNGVIAKSLDVNLLQLMQESGCIGFKIGIETGNAEMLKKTRKPAVLNTFRKVSQILNICPEIFVGGNFIIGFPGEKFFQMMDSFRFFLELNLDWAAFTMCQKIRGADAFSEFQDYFERQISFDGKIVKNFIPSRDSKNGHLSCEKEVVKGLYIFNIPYNSVPEEEQIKEIWFTFNLVGNYINNKNLRPEGSVEKFIPWVEMARLAYPTNPYMSLFLALAYTINGDLSKAKDHYKRANRFHKTDEYWLKRFKSFNLIDVINDFPEDKDGVFESLEALRREINRLFII